MAQFEIKFRFPVVLSMLVFISCKTNRQYQNGFTVEISHSAFLHYKENWSKVYSFQPISMVYKPEKKLIVISRTRVPDSLHMLTLSKAEENRIVKKYGAFEFLGIFEDHNLPPEFSHLFYVNPGNMDVLQIDRITADAKGTENLTGAILYMKDSINYMSGSRLFFK
ncbi:hypothetical protein [Chitinophaga pinensis]|uniref:Lipoprotein n=1 Tax=Chitinophaga pinensis (strain ATCC 43595 / DSM 2588 / LMG 13176 / NBRC 15968 / NCIMB 11800 / UQM 2034) TaxID=485918 RepID=A0A979GNY1_CHIPD|nr:hypothetical protein [Chitinophaga pinensis]ACU60037.1 hypothetical protein Cpin_2554 [Chitinophaga pinensis DSM 2588]